MKPEKVTVLLAADPFPIRTPYLLSNLPLKRSDKCRKKILKLTTCDNWQKKSFKPYLLTCTERQDFIVLFSN